MPAVRLQERRQVPVADQVPVREDDRAAARGQFRRQPLGRAFGARGGVHPVRRAEPVQRAVVPIQVVPPVPEAQREVRGVVPGELPQDVAGAQPAADAQHHGLGHRHPGVGQQMADRRGVRVQAAPQGPAAIGVRGGVADHVPACRGVPLTGLGHPRPDPGLEVFLLGHRCLCPVMPPPGTHAPALHDRQVRSR
jgi:hypothetical protein